MYTYVTDSLIQHSNLYGFLSLFILHSNFDFIISA